MLIEQIVHVNFTWYIYARRIFRAVNCLSDFGIFYGYVTVDILDKLDFLGFKNAKSAHHVCKKKKIRIQLIILVFLILYAQF